MYCEVRLHAAVAIANTIEKTIHIAKDRAIKESDST